MESDNLKQYRPARVTYVLFLSCIVCSYVTVVVTRFNRIVLEPKPIDPNSVRSVNDPECIHPVDRNDAPNSVNESDNGSSIKQNQTGLKEALPTESNISHLIAPRKGNVMMNDSMTGNLWNFKNPGDLQLYLVDNLLRKNWSSNHDNLVKLRQELGRYRSELNGTSSIIFLQGHVRAHQPMWFLLSPAKRPMTSSLYKRLAKKNPFPEKEKYKTCAVVGNSGLLLNSTCGSAIDGHDFIIRCNLAPLRRFTQDAGSKSNLTTMNPSILPTRYGSLRSNDSRKRYTDDIADYNGLIWLPCFSTPVWLSTCTKAITSYGGKNVQFVCGNPSHQKGICDFWAERSLERRLSTGMFMVMTAIQLCEEVHLYGFWPFSARYDNTRTNVPYHYFDNTQSGGAVHDMSSEFNLLLQLHLKGVIRLHVGSC